MKKLLKMLGVSVLTVMLVLSYTACKSDKGDINEDKTAGIQTSGQNDSKVQNKTDETIGNEENTELSQDEDSETDIKKKEVTIEETLLFDKDGITIAVTGYKSDDWADSIEFCVENNSDRDITISSDDVIINDYMTLESLYFEVSAGKKLNDSISLFDDSYGDTAGKVEIYFDIYDSETYDDLFVDEYFVFETSALEGMKRKSVDGTEVYNSDGVKIVVADLVKDEVFGYELKFYIENNSEKDIYVDNESMSMAVNGYMVTTLFGCSVRAEKAAYTGVTVFDSDLEENGIKEIDEIEIDIVVKDAATYEEIDEITVVYTVE